MRATLVVLISLAAACGGARPLQEVSGGGPDAGVIDGTPDAGGIGQPRADVVPTSLILPAQAGRVPAPGAVEVRNAGDAPLDWTATCTSLAVTPAAGRLLPGERAALTLAASLPEAVGQVQSSCSIAGVTVNVVLDVVAQPGVGYGGGSVDLLDFTFTGDTRPDNCEDLLHYPDAIIHEEMLQMAATGAQFAFDVGDHMNSCVNIFTSAQLQMQKYLAAIAGYPRPFFMTMGNHECGTNIDCSGASQNSDHNFQNFMTGLQAVSHKSTPYYSFDVQTRFGLARFVFLADNYAAQAWAEGVLADADRHAALTFVIKHHPIAGSRTGPAWSNDVVARHRVSMVLTGHDHEYRHDAVMNGRSVVCGLGGANTSATGFCRVQQQRDQSLRFTRYDLSGNPLDTWSVPQ